MTAVNAPLPTDITEGDDDVSSPSREEIKQEAWAAIHRTLNIVPTPAEAPDPTTIFSRAFPEHYARPSRAQVWAPELETTLMEEVNSTLAHTGTRLSHGLLPYASIIRQAQSYRPRGGPSAIPGNQPSGLHGINPLDPKSTLSHQRRLPV